MMAEAVCVGVGIAFHRRFVWIGMDMGRWGTICDIPYFLANIMRQLFVDDLRLMWTSRGFAGCDVNVTVTLVGRCGVARGR